MRHSPFIPMEYENEQLMADLNAFCIAVKVWVHQDCFGDKLRDLQARYPNPSIRDIDEIMNRLMQVLRKDSKPMIKY